VRSDCATYKFETSSAACSFIRALGAEGIKAGFPGLGDHTVQVAIPTWMARETADRVAGGAPVVAYKFGNERRRPCPVCRDGSCMLCDDNGTIPIDQEEHHVQ